MENEAMIFAPAAGAGLWVTSNRGDYHYSPFSAIRRFE
jgi:hypothetical protein